MKVKLTGVGTFPKLSNITTADNSSELCIKLSSNEIEMSNNCEGISASSIFTHFLIEVSNVYPTAHPAPPPPVEAPADSVVVGVNYLIPNPENEVVL